MVVVVVGGVLQTCLFRFQAGGAAVCEKDSRPSHLNTCSSPAGVIPPSLVRRRVSRGEKDKEAEASQVGGATTAAAC